MASYKSRAANRSVRQIEKRYGEFCSDGDRNNEKRSDQESIE